jgi:methylated-DNA-[protein]-cysteine S-methyltransferase
MNIESFYSDYLERYVRIAADNDVVREISFHTERPRELRTERPTDGDLRTTTSVATDIRDYLTGADVDFSSYTLDLEGLTDFETSVIREARKIPRGGVVTYSELAQLAGRPRAARSVGSVMRRNSHLILVPCHRVVGKHTLGGFSSGLEVKRKLLRLEGYLQDA